MFQHTAARRRLRGSRRVYSKAYLFQHTAARRRLLRGAGCKIIFEEVSTHSRPKAAANLEFETRLIGLFQHTAARRRLPRIRFIAGSTVMFQHTAARRRLPGLPWQGADRGGFNTQPPEGGCPLRRGDYSWAAVSTHSRPKAAASRAAASCPPPSKFQHTAARRRLPKIPGDKVWEDWFQHTAARRRLLA